MMATKRKKKVFISTREVAHLLKTTPNAVRQATFKEQEKVKPLLVVAFIQSGKAFYDLDMVNLYALTRRGPNSPDRIERGEIRNSRRYDK
jgi:hypothetical protein